MKRRWSQIAGMPIVEDGDHVVGHLNGIFLNPETGQIIAYLVGLTHVLVPVDIEQWRKDAILVSGPDVLVPPMEILRIQEFGLKRTLLLTKQVQTRAGQVLGRLVDFTINTGTDVLVNITCQKKMLWMIWDQRQFDWKDIVEITDRAIVVSEDLSPEKEMAPAAA